VAQINHLDRLPMAIYDDERAFFARLGARIAELRRSQDITQVQLAETLGVSQQTINSYEVGRRRVPVSALPTLGVSLEALIGEKAPPVKRGPTPKFQQQLERLDRLPQAKQRVVMEMLEGVLMQASRG